MAEVNFKKTVKCTSNNPLLAAIEGTNPLRSRSRSTDNLKTKPTRSSSRNDTGLRNNQQQGEKKLVVNFKKPNAPLRKVNPLLNALTGRRQPKNTMKNTKTTALLRKASGVKRSKSAKGLKILKAPKNSATRKSKKSITSNSDVVVYKKGIRQKVSDNLQSRKNQL